MRFQLELGVRSVCIEPDAATGRDLPHESCGLGMVRRRPAGISGIDRDPISFGRVCRRRGGAGIVRGNAEPARCGRTLRDARRGRKSVFRAIRYDRGRSRIGRLDGNWDLFGPGSFQPARSDERSGGREREAENQQAGRQRSQCAQNRGARHRSLLSIDPKMLLAYWESEGLSVAAVFHA